MKLGDDLLALDELVDLTPERIRVAFSLPVPTEMAILKGVVHVTDTPTSCG